MFRISAIKKFIVKNKSFFIIAFFIFLISLLFPYSGDDWYWGSKNLSIASIVSMAKDIELNGRYLGNIIVIMLTENIFIRGIIISLRYSLMLLRRMELLFVVLPEHYLMKKRLDGTE